jgi:aspartate aminotransferase
MVSLSRKARGVTPSATLAISAKAKAMQAEGHDVIGFGAGEPDFDTPDNIKNAAKAALDAGYTKYTPASGAADLKDAVAARYQRTHGIPYAANQVVISCGGKHALYNIFQAMCDPGDEVIFAAPYWVSYPEMIKLADGVPVVVSTSAEDNYTLSAEAIAAHLTDKTKAVIINSPSNPTGTMYTREQLEAIADLALERGFCVISDEIYDEMVFEGSTFESIATLRPGMEEQTLIINAVSKTYSMTGWRVGWTLGPADIIKAMGGIQSHSTSNPTSIAQAAALEAITGPQDAVSMMLNAFQERRDVIQKLVGAIPGVTYAKPEGAFYIFPDFSAYFTGDIKGSNDLANHLLDTVQVALVPGGAFGDDRCARLSYATSMENIEAGVERIAKALA